MKLIEQEWNPHLNAYEKTWIADEAGELEASFDSDSACGSIIMVISTGSTYMKNSAGKWQKVGSTEVV